jgi:alpha-glucosidase
MADTCVDPNDPTPWWRDAVVYQIYPRSFADSNGDGIGDLCGHHGQARLPRRPRRRCIVAVADLHLTDARFRLRRRRLLRHRSGVRHRRRLRRADRRRPRSRDATAARLGAQPTRRAITRGSFESRTSRDNPKREWYVWRDRRADGSPPSNWMSQFKGVPAWTHDDTTDQSYLHVFLADQPDLNWANPDVEAAMHETLCYWLDRGVDNFRADVVNLIGKGTDVDDLPEHLVTMPLLATDRSFGHELLRRIRSLLDGYAHEPMMVGEVYLLRDGESASYLGDLDGGAPELHLSFDFRPLHTPWDADRAAPSTLEDGDRLRGAGMADLRTVEPRPATPTHPVRFGGPGTRLGGDGPHGPRDAVPVRGRGLGLEDGVVPAHRVVDPDGRDGCRAPMPWTADGDDEVGHGWPVRPWLPFPANAGTHAARFADRANRHRCISLYRQLLALRHERPVLRRGSIEFAPVQGECHPVRTPARRPACGRAGQCRRPRRCLARRRHGRNGAAVHRPDSHRSRR